MLYIFNSIGVNLPLWKHQFYQQSINWQSNYKCWAPELKVKAYLTQHCECFILTMSLMKASPCVCASFLSTGLRFIYVVALLWEKDTALPTSVASNSGLFKSAYANRCLRAVFSQSPPTQQAYVDLCLGQCMPYMRPHGMKNIFLKGKFLV